MQSAEVLADSPPSDTPLTYDVKEAAAVLGVSLGTVYQAIKQKQLPAIRLGRKIVLPRAALHRLLEEGRVF